MLPLLFITITLAACILFYLGSGSDKRIVPVLLIWVLLTGILSYIGFFERTDTIPPRMLLVFIPALAGVFYYWRKADVTKLQTNWLVAVHMLRLPVEITLYRLFLQGKVPVIMTFEGWNFDIIMGITAIGIGLYVWRIHTVLLRRWFALWNLMGILFLAIIVVTAILSAPSPIQRLAFDQPNTAILMFPYTFLPAVVVPLVLLSHLLCLKQLRQSRKTVLAA